VRKHRAQFRDSKPAKPVTKPSDATKPEAAADTALLQRRTNHFGEAAQPSAGRGLCKSKPVG
jgi:hypothetical protein